MCEQYYEGEASRYSKSVCISCNDVTHSVCLGSPCECAESDHKVVKLEKVYCVHKIEIGIL